MGRDHDGVPLIGELVDDRRQPLSARRVDAGKRLVHQEQLCAARQGTGDQHPLALAAGKLTEGGLRKLGEADEIECCERLPALGTPRPPPPSPTGERAHQHDVERAHGIVEARPVALRHVTAPRSNLDPARQRRQQAQHHFEESRFAATVRPEDTDPLSAPDGKRDALDRRRTAVSGAHSIELGQQLADHLMNRRLRSERDLGRARARSCGRSPPPSSGRCPRPTLRARACRRRACSRHSPRSRARSRGRVSS